MKKREDETQPHYDSVYIHKYQQIFLIGTGLCSLLTLLLFICESNNIYQPSGPLEREDDEKDEQKQDIITKSLVASHKAHTTDKLAKQVFYSYHVKNQYKSEQKLKSTTEFHMIRDKDRYKLRNYSFSNDLHINFATQEACQLKWKPETIQNSSNMHKILEENVIKRIKDKQVVKNYIFKNRLVHFDLKGAPPKVEYFTKILPLLKKNGATGILLEYEDTFPFHDALAPIATGNAYCVKDIQRIQMIADALQLEVIPLVQTFGHMEFVLKLDKFEHLREANDSPSAICPSNANSFILITEMIDQVLSLHPKSKRLHIGCDEVFHLGICKKCNKYQYKKDILYLQHVLKIARYIKKKHRVIPIIWDDMIRRTSSRVLKSVKIGSFVEPMVWVYAEDVPSLFFPRMWQRYRTIFQHMWAASAFKGAFGRDIILPNAKRHLHNHISWLSVMSQQTTKGIDFRGIVLTGWQRYEHFAPLCELLPVGLPSLILNLLTVSQGGYSSDLLQKMQKILNCSSFSSSDSHFPIDADPFLQHTMKLCTFPGSAIFHTAQKYKTINDGLLNSIHYLCNFRSNRGGKLLHKDKMENINQVFKCNITINSLFSNCKTALSEVFDQFTVSEWMQQNLIPMVYRLKKFKDLLNNEHSFNELCRNYTNKYIRKFPIRQ